MEPWPTAGRSPVVRAAADRLYPVKLAIPLTGTAGVAAGALGAGVAVGRGATVRGGVVAGGGVGVTGFGVTATVAGAAYIV